VLETILVFAVAHALALTDAQRIAAKEAIERARYVFVIGDKPPFETRYPRSFFVKQLEQEHQREAVLRQVFGVTMKKSDLAYEYRRIEKSTRAPDQWEAIKKAVHNKRSIVEEVVCRPLLVDRALRAKFDFDQSIHATPHAAARKARQEFLAGHQPAGATTVTLSRSAGTPEETDEMLRKAQAESSVPRVLTPGAPTETPKTVPLEPEAAALLEKELKKPGDVSTILEYRDRFEVYKLLEIKPATWRVNVVRFPKEDFDKWYAATVARLR